MAIEDELKSAVADKRAIIGTKEVVKALKKGSVKKVVFAKNLPDSARKDMEHYRKITGLEISEFNGTGKQLGIFCGKPFGISMVAIKEGKK